MKTFNRLEIETSSATSTEKVACQVYLFQPKDPEPRDIKKGRLFSDFAKNFSLGEDHEKTMSDARQWLGDELSRTCEHETLAVLRLKKGLSQEQLAKIIGTKQPNVARFEKGQSNPYLETIRKWCDALQIDMNTFDLAQRASTEANRGKL